MATVDFDKPLEAVHADGRVVPAKYDSVLDCRGHNISFDTGSGEWSWCVDHEGAAMALNDWSIRNVEPTLRTSDEALRRMEALVERMDVDGDAADQFAADWVREAIAIQALRNPPIDPRIALVVTALVQNGIGKPVAPLFARDVLKALDAASC